MPRFRFPRHTAIGVSLGIIVACMTLPAFADSPTMVTFQANNPWTQQVGSVNHYNSSHDYSVAIAVGKTLQINLVTRDPNVFFKVQDQTHRKQLLDTYQTGATTWSRPNPTATDYTIHVYVDPAAMQRGEDAKYALQIGQYGAEDMQAATAAVTFQDNNPWAQVTGSLDNMGTAQNYTVAIAAGETLAVNLIPRNPGVHFKVKDPTNNQILVDTGQTGASKWSTPVATATTFTIEVYVDPAAVPRGVTAGYALQIGHYDTGAAPAGASTAATPAAASSSPNAMAPTPVAPAPASSAAPMPPSAATTHR